MSRNNKTSVSARKSHSQPGTRANSIADSDSPFLTPNRTQQRLGPKYQCIFCDIAIEDGNCIECFDCKKWAHFKCSKLTKRQFDFLVENSGDSIQWHCQSCYEGEVDRKTETEVKIDYLIKQMETMQSVITKLESGFTGTSLDEKIERVVERKLAKALDERNEKEKRKCCLIVVGLQESEEARQSERSREDTSRLRDLLSKIDDSLAETLVEEPVRLGKKTNRPRLLKIKVKDETAKEKILKNYQELNRNVQRKEDKIYFNPDHTPLERQRYKDLREQIVIRTNAGERDLVIRNGKIVSRSNVAGRTGDAGVAEGGAAAPVGKVE